MGVQGNRFFKADQCQLWFFQLLKRQSTVIVCLGKCGFDLNGFVKAVHGCLRRLYFQQTFAPGMQSQRVLWVGLNGLVKAFDGFVPFAQRVQGLTPVQEHGRFI